MRVKCVPITSTSPSVGRSMPASRFSNVDLPEPLGPINARKSPWYNSRSTWSNATISKPSRVKRFDTLRTRTIGSDMFFILRLLNFDTIAVAQLLDFRDRDRLVATQSIQYHVCIAGFFTRANRSLLDAIPFHDKHKRAVVLFNDRGLRHEHARDCLAVTARSFIRKEVDARIHFGPQLFVRILDFDLHLDRRLRAIRFGCDLFDEAGEPEIRISLGNDLGALPRLQPREVRLTDVELDLQVRQFREVDNC